MAKSPAGKNAGSGKGSRPTGASKAAPGSKSSRARKPPPVVTQNPRPWGWIAVAVVVAVFAAGAIGYAVYSVNKQNESDTPESIAGLTTKTFEGLQHSTEQVDYGEDSPPFGGVHDGVWLDCNGQVYDFPVREENAVHGLEHGAIWITYDPDLPQDDVDTLAELVDGQGFTFMSPYPGLSSPVSLQAWGQQVFVDSVDDPRVEQFIRVFRQSPTNTPEPGATCDRPDWLAAPQTEETDSGATETGATDPSEGSGAPSESTTDPAATTAP